MDGLCCFCKHEQETKDHLFFSCLYSKAIWKLVLSLCGLDREVLDWEGEMKWAVLKLKGKALLSKVLRIAWSSFIYHIWKKRNGRIFGKMEQTAEQIIDHIKLAVRHRLASLKNVAPDTVNISLYRSWGLFDSIFSL